MRDISTHMYFGFEDWATDKQGFGGDFDFDFGFSFVRCQPI